MIMGADKKNPDPDIMKGQDAAATGHLMDPAGPLLPFSSGEDRSAYAPNMYAPQGQTFFYRGYDTPPGEWNEYPQFVNAEGLEIGSPGVYNENPSLMFHTGYGYSPQMPYGPYSPVTTPLPSVGDDSQLYSPHAYPFSGPPYYQQLVSPTMPYVTSPTQPSQPDITPMVRVDQQGDGRLHGPRPSYPPPMGSFSGGSFPGNFGFHDQTQGFNGLGSGGLWSDWSKPSDRQRPLTPLSPAVSPQPIGSLRPFSQLIGMNPQRQRAPYGFGSGSDSYNRGGYLQSSFNPSSSFGSISSLGPNAPGWLPLENSGRRWRTASSLCSCNGAALDILSEQNRGPRASKPKTQSSVEGNPTVDGSKNCPSNVKICGESCNRSDFVTDYEDAKFFVIKSYSEDNVHRSIKYGVWASTPNGNRKLDAAYREAKEKKGQCPVFLLFSVNASAQFCGVAEMVGPVDFERSVDYWQQDKWSGQLSVKWHIIKDVPNSQFRHIVLENNDNKPVTNSRDTQEVKLEQGIEMLKIFATYETNVSILDDFDYYEDRQKVMQERKARQQESSSLISANVIGGNEPKASAALPTGFIKQVSKSFAQAVRLDESGKEGEIAEKTDEVKLEDAITSTSAAETG